MTHPIAAPAVPRPFAGLMPIAILILLLAALPVVASLIGSPFLLKIGTRVVVFSLAAVALNIVLGFGGLVSLLHAGLFGIGGYVVGVLAFQAEAGEPLFGFIPGSTELAIVLPVAICVSAIVAAAMGIVSLRTGGAYFIMITLAFNQMLYYFFIALQKYGGDDGLQINGDITLFGFAATGRTPFYLGCVAVLAVVLILSQRLVASRFGVVLRASSQNERRLTALGIPPLRYQLAAFAISGAIAGLGGALLAAGQQFISPSEMSWVRSGDLVVMCVLGGMSTVWGPVLGAAVFLILEIILSEWTIYWQLGFGLIIIGIVVLLRGGLTDLLRMTFGRANP
ncbi:branched-chain amino acid ABC transporter permease [Tardiphaga sp.]|uniref:branched-chain amino acid ABC transporter permease n=1 Tax=Tardiphaga sp. TaxID=1926292 RepID=UPI0026041369|nr:branched-chain amino acid ABC transporter permease [Tardiphaga sp.]